MRFGKKYVSLQTAMVLFVCLVVSLSLTVTGILIGVNEANSTRDALSQKAMTVAQTVALSPLVIEALEGKRNQGDVDTFATKVLEQTKVRFIVVMDMNHIRLSHPNTSLIGQHFVGGDEDAAMHGKAYISTAKGTLGESLRAFMPIYGDGGKQVGVVSVGIMTDHVHDVIWNSERVIYTGIGVGIVVGIIGAWVLAARIKKILLGLEPFEIVNLWHERNAMLESVREGILAVHQDGTVIVANAEAMRMFRRGGIEEDPVGRPIEDMVPNFRFESVLAEGKPSYDDEYDLNGYSYVVNRVPIQVNHQVVGVVATFRDKTELKQLAEQLTGVKLYAEALRAQAHEFMNKLHVILGMVHIGEYSRLSTYIHQITEHFQVEVGAISRLVKDPVLVGFLLSKLSYAREHQVQLRISGDCSLPVAKDPNVVDDIITILGNLLDNGFEAVESQDVKEIDVQLEYDEEHFHAAVTDTGPGVPEELREVIFQKGFSTKGTNRGYGLFLVKRSIEKLGGTLCFETDGQWTTFTVTLPYVEGGVED